MKAWEIAGLAVLAGITAIVFAAALMNHPLGGEPVAIIKVTPPTEQIADRSPQADESHGDQSADKEANIGRDGIFPGMIIGHVEAP